MADKDLDAAEYLQFINSKSITPVCPLCKNEHWSIVAEAKGHSYGIPKTHRSAPDLFDMVFTPILLLTCKNCGFIAPILREKVVTDLEG